MHQAAALAVVDEEVAIDPETELAQFFQHQLLGMGVTLAVVVERRDQALRHGDVVFQFRTFARQNAVFDQLRLLIAQLTVQGDHQRADDRDSQDQGQDPQGNDFVLELHGESRVSR